MREARGFADAGLRCSWTRQSGYHPRRMCERTRLGWFLRGECWPTSSNEAPGSKTRLGQVDGREARGQSVVVLLFPNPPALYSTSLDPLHFREESSLRLPFSRPGEPDRGGFGRGRGRRTLCTVVVEVVSALERCRQSLGRGELESRLLFIPPSFFWRHNR
jgi:hypothetical protein